MNKGMSTGGKIAVVLLLVIVGVFAFFLLQGRIPYSGGASGILPKPILHIGSVSFNTQGNVLQGYNVPVTFVVSNSGNGDATSVRATVTLYDSKGNLRGNQDTFLGTISPGGTASGTVRFDVGRLETITGTQFAANIHVSCNEGAYADY